MTQPSTRYLVPLLLMLLATAVPVTAHYVIGLPNEDCDDLAALRNVASIEGATGVAEWSSHYSYAVSQFTRGEAYGARFVWVRASVPQPFYGERPFYTPGYWTDGPSHLVRTDVDGVEVPIRVWRQQVMGNTEVTANLMIYRGRPVADVFESSLTSALDTMFNGPPAVNFIGITGGGPTSRADAAQERLVNWLLETWSHYQRTCGS